MAFVILLLWSLWNNISKNLYIYLCLPFILNIYINPNSIHMN